MEVSSQAPAAFTVLNLGGMRRSGGGHSSRGQGPNVGGQAPSGGGHSNGNSRQPSGDRFSQQQNNH